MTYGHTFTSNLLSYGAAPKDVQELLGHSDVNTTMNIYAHATREAKRSSARLLDREKGRRVNLKALENTGFPRDRGPVD
jgi:integrase